MGRIILWVLFVLVLIGFGLNGACVISTATQRQNEYSGMFYFFGAIQMAFFGTLGAVFLWVLRRRPPEIKP